MKVVMHLGKVTPKVVQGLKSMSDDIDYVVYNSVGSFVQEAEARRLAINRVIFNNKFVANGESDYAMLNDFIHSFSSATELVMVINSGDTDSEAMFNKYFSSPLHSCAIVKGAASMDFFRDIVSLPISDVKARYYTLDKNSGDAVTSKSVNSKLGGFKGGVKKPSENVNSSGVKSDVSEPVSKPESSGSDFSQGFEEKKPVEPATNTVIPVSGSDFGSSDFESGFDSSQEVVGSSLLSDSTSEDFSSSNEDDMLSVGEFGRNHSDTDMFDEEDEAEESPAGGLSSVDEEERKRRDALAELNREAAKVQAAGGSKKNVIESKHSGSEGDFLEFSEPVFGQPELVVPATPAKPKGSFNGSLYEKRNINIVLSCGQFSATQRIVDDAIGMMESGLNVLIVDMDFAHNNILSFINKDAYYSKNHNAYSNGSLYVEDKVGVISGGYGFTPSRSEIKGVFAQALAKNCDMVIVDCPIRSVRFLSNELLEKSNIIVFSDNDPGQVVATALAVTDRNNCSLELERVIMSKGKPLFVGDGNCLLEETVSKMFFANGCWIK